MNWISKKITLYIEKGKLHKKKKNINSILMRNSLFLLYTNLHKIAYAIF